MHSSAAAEEGVLNEPDRGCLACHYAASGEQASTGVHHKKSSTKKSQSTVATEQHTQELHCNNI